MSSRRRHLFGIAGLMLLAGCNTGNTHLAEEDPFMGEAVKYNSALQTINPTPVYAQEGAQPGDSGALGAAAVKRYRTDKVKEVQTMTTTTNAAASGSR